jgi:hypothetical protein
VSLFATLPGRTHRCDVEVMQRSTQDDLAEIQRLWRLFERQVGLRGRRMYALVRDGTYSTCTPIRPGDDPETLGLQRGLLPGGWYLRGRLSGTPPGLYDKIGPGVAELGLLAGTSIDAARPVVEYYRRNDQVELWIPILG